MLSFSHGPDVTEALLHRSAAFHILQVFKVSGGDYKHAGDMHSLETQLTSGALYC